MSPVTAEFTFALISIAKYVTFCLSIGLKISCDFNIVSWLTNIELMCNSGVGIAVADNISLQELDSEFEKLGNPNGISTLMLTAELILRLVAKEKIVVIIKSGVSKENGRSLLDSKIWGNTCGLVGLEKVRDLTLILDADLISLFASNKKRICGLTKIAVLFDIS